MKVWRSKEPPLSPHGDISPFRGEMKTNAFPPLKARSPGGRVVSRRDGGVLLLPFLMLSLLLRPALTMDAASDACRLFITAVFPGLFPYMTLSLMLVSRLKRRMTPALALVLGWGGGSPTGARLLPLCPRLTGRQRTGLMVGCATMSPMFLLGTLGEWLHSGLAGAVILVSVLLGGGLAGLAAGGCTSAENAPVPAAEPDSPLTFGAAVEQSAQTMLLVCGTMVMLRVFAAQAAHWLPAALPLTTLLEVTTGARGIASLPLPLPLRTALLAGATGFGGAAILMQNRAALGEGAPPLAMQVLWQALHGGISFLLALGMMTLAG